MTNRQLFWIGNASYSILLILAICWYQERSAFIDQAFHLFYLLKDGDFAIQNYRIVAYFSQVFPLVTAHYSSDFTLIAMSYSVGFVLINMFYFNLLFLVEKSGKFALLLLLFNILLVAHTFFWIQSELPQTLSLMVVFYALVYILPKHSSVTKKAMILIAALSALLLIGFSHPLMIIPFLFMGFYLCYSDYISLKSFCSVSLGIILLYAIKFKYYSTEYDSGAMEGLKNFKYLFPDYLHLPTNKVFLGMALKAHSLYWLIWTISVVYLVRKKSYFSILILATSTFLYLLLINVSYPNNTEPFYLENLYLPISIFLLVVLIFNQKFPSIYRSKFTPLIVITIILYQLGQKICSAGFYKDRLNYLKELRVDDSCGPFAILDPKSLKMDLIMMPWASSYEFWVIGNLEKDLTRAKIISNPHFHFCGYTEVLITQWGNITGDDLKKPFFAYTDLHGYQCCHDH